MSLPMPRPLPVTIATLSFSRIFILPVLLQHDPEMIPKKPALGLDPRVGTGFRKRSCSNNKIERDDDSKKGHRALAGVDLSSPLLDRKSGPPRGHRPRLFPHCS